MIFENIVMPPKVLSLLNPLLRDCRNLVMEIFLMKA
jgi:hypothetical protein